MNQELMKKLKSVCDELELIDDQLTSGDTARHYVEVTDDADDGSIRLGANSEGFVHLAMMMLDLAVSKSPGNHVHYDETTLLDKCDRGLTIVYRPAEWD